MCSAFPAQGESTFRVCEYHLWVGRCCNDVREPHQKGFDLPANGGGRTKRRRSERKRREKNSENCSAGSSAAALRFPGTGALAALPGAGARGAGELARAGRALAAGAYHDGDLAIAGNLAVDGGGARSLGDEGAILDADRIAIGAVAGALVGDDHNAPGAVKAGCGASRGVREHGGNPQKTGAKNEIPEILLNLRHEPRPVFMSRPGPGAFPRARKSVV